MSMYKKRGQISVELLITFGFALMMLIPLTILLYEHTIKTQEDVNNNQIGLIARKIIDSANSVYYLGHPTSITLKVYMPSDIKNISFANNEITFKLKDNNEIVSTANVNLTGSLIPSSGLKFIRISAMQNYVNITENAD